MIYPDLLNTTDSFYGFVADSVFEDLRLDNILTNATLSNMKRLPIKEDIYKRRELFECLGTSNVLREALKALAEGAGDIERLYRAYTERSEGVAKYYNFAFLLLKVAAFYKNASTVPTECAFLEEFGGFFAEQGAKKEFITMAERAAAVCENAERCVRITLRKDSVKLCESAGEDLTSTIYNSAVEMGLKPSVSSGLHYQLSNSFAEDYFKLYPKTKAELESLHKEYCGFVDANIIKYKDQISFYLDVYRLVNECKSRGVVFSFPDITESKKIALYDACDITLISKDTQTIVSNDIIFDGKEPFFFLTGANGGGKTTYLRNCGVNLIFALNGCPTPCNGGETAMLTGVYTHFPRDERFEADGRFFDEQKRVDAIVEKADANSFVLLNETYSTTTEEKASIMTRELSLKLAQLGCFTIYVTHQKDISSLDFPVLRCDVDSGDDNRRTYKISRGSALQGSMAQDILKKYSLDRQKLIERFGEF